MNNNVSVYCSAHRANVEAWLSFHGFVQIDDGWNKPYSNENAKISFEDNCWIGVINAS